MARQLTILQFADRIEMMAKGLNKAVLPRFRKNLKIMQRALYAEYWENKFGARIWKWRQEKFNLKGGPSVKLGAGRRRSYARWSASSSAWLAQIRISGMAAMMETGGGRLRRHVIFGKAERKPGQQVPQMPVYDRVVESKLWDKNVDDVSESFWKFVERTF
ncbi:MAG: hypothetical protein JSV16_08015 [Candidatus Hydrogenedentota bacterium]|nr:MAG: hypothetical protein JSV16_08015 [Candidatus Hydrogenedentota bacterium]